MHCGMWSEESSFQRYINSKKVANLIDNKQDRRYSDPKARNG